MNENATLRICIPVDDLRLRANWRAVHAFKQGKLQPHKQQNENSDKIP